MSWDGKLPPDMFGDHILHAMIKNKRAFNIISCEASFHPEALSHKNHDGHTPLDLARSVGDKKTIAVIEREMIANGIEVPKQKGI
ncbi:MAG: hypothetical protein K8953_00210 [Proteobacteria bacterium]|nr:hypothetical protein [Pseudomonadota bacterium]